MLMSRCAVDKIFTLIDPSEFKPEPEMGVLAACSGARSVV
jgi:hypothetical protein